MIVYGKQVCKTLLSRHPEMVTRLFLAKEIAKGEFAAIRRLRLPIERLDAKKAQAMARGGNHQGWLCEVRPYPFADINDLKRENFLVVLAGVTDVGNIGAIVRSAYALGADGVIVAGIRQLALEGVARSSAGALFDLPLALAPKTADLLNELKQVGFTLFGADARGEALEEVRFPEKRVLVLGSEGEGIPPKIRGKIDTMVSIAMARPFDSLNVSAAAAILIYRMRDA